MLTSLLSAKLAAVAAAAAVTLGSAAAAAAYAGKLPSSVQNIAHDTIGAPKTPGAQPAHPVTPQPTKTPGRAAYGLCTAFAHLKAHGSAAQRATAFRRLAAAAGGATRVTTYCAGVAHPGAAHPEAATGGGHPAAPRGSHPRCRRQPSAPIPQASPPRRPRTGPSPHRRGSPLALPDQHGDHGKAAAGICLSRLPHQLGSPRARPVTACRRDRASNRRGCAHVSMVVRIDPRGGRRAVALSVRTAGRPARRRRISP